MNVLPEQIAAFIRNKTSSSFEKLSLDLFRHQYSLNAPYRRLCASVGASPETLSSWRQIPAAPAQAFRLFDLTCTPIEFCKSVYYSSGTTSDTSSKHWMDDDALELYEISLAVNFIHEFSNIGRLWAVMPAPSDAPNSSLTHMLSTLNADKFAGSELEKFSDSLAMASLESLPITMFGTAFGLLELIAIKQVSLPRGSRVIETGGFKGRSKEISRQEFYGMLRHGIGVDDAQCHSEYGMCELASQFFSHGETGRLHGPHWVRTRCIDPLTNDDAAPGEPGLLRHYDLANLNSVAVIQSQDRAVLYEDGGFSLLGRATDAELRGCSLTAEELWSH